jgi:O-antigen/teichoic acid export membrane protein
MLRLIDRYRRILGQGVWVLGGQAFTGVFSLAGTRLVTQYVSPEVYGLANLAQNAVLLLRTLFCSPLLNTGLRYYPEAQHGNYVPALYEALRRALARATLAMEPLVVIGTCIWIWKSRVGASTVLTLAIFLCADVFRTFEVAMFSAARRQGPAAFASAGEALLKPLLIVGGVLFFGGSIEVVLGATAASVLATLIGVRAAARRNLASRGGAVPPAISAEMRTYAIPLIPIALLNWATAVSDRYLIQWLTHDAQSVGLYAAGYGLISQPFLMLHGVAALTLRPVYFAAVSREDSVQAAKVFRVWLAVTGGICAVAAALIFVFRDLLVGALLGPKYGGAAIVVPWIALGYLFYVIEQVLEQHLLAHKRTRAVLSAQVFGAVSSLIVTIPLVATHGMVGAAYACPVYFAIQCLIAGVLVLRTPNQALESDDAIL